MNKFRNYKRYWIYSKDNLEFYLKKQKGFIYIYKHEICTHRDDCSNDSLWMDIGFLDIKILWKSSYSDESYICIIMIKDINGKGRIIDLLSKQTILEKFIYNSYRGIARRTICKDIHDYNSQHKKDVVVSFLNKKTKYFALYSLEERNFIFGPYNYVDIEDDQFGVILDEKLIVNNNGDMLNLSEYEATADSEVYYNNKKNDYVFVREVDGSLFHFFDSDKKDNNLLKLNFEEYIVTFNKETEELQTESINQNERDLDDWSWAADIAYEGYSRLELGLD